MAIIVMTNNDQKDIWQQYLLNETDDSVFAISRVKCACDDCGYWREGGLCIAPEIELGYQKDANGRVICECKTYEGK